MAIFVYTTKIHSRHSLNGFNQCRQPIERSPPSTVYKAETLIHGRRQHGISLSQFVLHYLPAYVPYHRLDGYISVSSSTTQPLGLQTLSPRPVRNQVSSHTPKMELVILAAAFLGSSLWSMYTQVPFIRIDPTNTALQRLVGSFQLTSIIYALQEIHPLVFPEATLDPPPVVPREPFPLPPKTQGVIRTMTEYVDMATARVSSPAHGRNRSVNLQETSLQPIWRGPTNSHMNGRYTPIFPFAFGLLMVGAAMLVAWNSKRGTPATEDQSTADRPPSDGVVVDRVLFQRLLETLTHEFQNRPSAADEQGQDSASNIVGVLDLLKVKLPPGAGHDNTPPTYNALLRLSQRVTKVEKAINLMFPPVEVPGTSGPGDDSGARPQASEQTGFARYKEEFGKNLNAIDVGRNYAKLIEEINALKNDVVMQESLNECVQDLQDEMARLYEAIASVTAIDDEEELSVAEKESARRYTDERVKRTNAAFQAKFNHLDHKLVKLGDRLKETEENHGSKLDRLDPTLDDTLSSLRKEVDNLKQTQGVFNRKAGAIFTNLDQRMTSLTRTLESGPTGLEPLTTLGPELRTENLFLQRVVEKLDISIKWIHEIGQAVRGQGERIAQHGTKIAELQKQLRHARNSSVFLEVENQKLWTTLKRVVPDGLSEVVGSGDDSQSSKGSQVDPRDGAENIRNIRSQPGAQIDQETVAALETARLPDPNASTTPRGGRPETAYANRSGTWKVNIHDAETHLESEEMDASSDAALPSVADDLPARDVAEKPQTLTTLGMERPANDEDSAAWERSYVEHFQAKEHSSDANAETESGELIGVPRHVHSSAADDLTFQPPSRSTTVPGDEVENQNKHSALGVEGAANDEISAAWEREVEQLKTGRSANDTETVEGSDSAPESGHYSASSMPKQSRGKGESEEPEVGQDRAQGGAAGDAEAIQNPQEKAQDRDSPAPENRVRQTAIPKGSSASSAMTRAREMAQKKQFLARLERQRKRKQAWPPANEGPVEPEGIMPDMKATESPQATPVPAPQPPIPTPAAPAGHGQEAKQHAQSGKLREQSQTSTPSAEKSKPQPMRIPFDFSAYGQRDVKNIPSFPPAGTKTDYQPSTPKNPGQFGRDQKGAQRKSKDVARRPIGQPPPVRGSATTEERRKIQGWGVFSDSAFAKEKEESRKTQEEAQNNSGPASASWQESVTWKQRKGSLEGTDSAPENGGRRRSEPPGGTIARTT